MPKKSILITGGSSGVGEALVDKFLNSNWKVYSISRTRIFRDNKNFISLNCNISSYSEVVECFNKVGELNAVVNNAAIFKSSPFLETDIETVENIINTNLLGSIYCTREALKKIKSGNIINISSVSGINGIENQTAYSASKHGVIGFSNSLSKELINSDINVTTICPGGIDTPLWNDKNPYPGKRSDLTSPEEIADLVYFITQNKLKTVFKNITLFPNSEWH